MSIWHVRQNKRKYEGGAFAFKSIKRENEMKYVMLLFFLANNKIENKRKN